MHDLRLLLLLASWKWSFGGKCLYCESEALEASVSIALYCINKVRNCVSDYFHWFHSQACELTQLARDQLLSSVHVTARTRDKPFFNQTSQWPALISYLLFFQNQVKFSTCNSDIGLAKSIEIWSILSALINIWKPIWEFLPIPNQIVRFILKPVSLM